MDKTKESPYQKYRTYKIQKGDTLASVARDLGVKAKELRWYHNMYCELQDLIEEDFKSYSQFLILAPEKYSGQRKEKEEKKAQKVSLASDYKLPFAADRINEDYKVQYTTIVGNEVDTLEMEISVKWLATDKNSFHLFEINRRAIYINNKVPDTIMDKLAAKTAKVLYPLKIVVDDSGKWIDLFNYDEIESRWGKVKSEILDYYEGAVVEKYIEHVECTLESSERLLGSLCADYFVRAFFNGIHVGYTADYEFQKDLSFPLEKETESVFRVEHKMYPNLDNDGNIRIEQKGNYIDSGVGFLYGHAHLKVNYNAAYSLNSDTYTIEKMNLECSIEKVQPIKTTIEIELLKIKKDKLIENYEK
jgi:hypothetical protein